MNRLVTELWYSTKKWTVYAQCFLLSCSDVAIDDWGLTIPFVASLATAISFRRFSLSLQLVIPMSLFCAKVIFTSFHHFFIVLLHSKSAFKIIYAKLTFFVMEIRVEQSMRVVDRSNLPVNGLFVLIRHWYLAAGPTLTGSVLDRSSWRGSTNCGVRVQCPGQVQSNAKVAHLFGRKAFPQGTHPSPRCFVQTHAPLASLSSYILLIYLSQCCQTYFSINTLFKGIRHINIPLIPLI